MMTIATEQTAPAVEIKPCTNCDEPHDKEEMIHCMICYGHFCLYCSCNCDHF